MKPNRVAIVLEWMTSRGGAERVLQGLLTAYPHARLFTSVFRPSVFPELRDNPPVTTWLQKLPVLSRKHQTLLPLLPKAMASLDLTGYDLIISSSSAFGKGIRRPEGSVHICYCHTPMRWVWEPDIDRRLSKLPLGGLVIRLLKKWDLESNSQVDHFIANSSFTARRIKQYYNREAKVVFPPVTISAPDTRVRRDGDFYFVISRLVGYKRFDLAVQACTKLSRRLIVAGDGPELKALKRMAGPTVEFLGRVSEQRRLELFARGKALLYPGEEDFGIVPVEAMSQGMPVIAYGSGGILESAIDGVTAVLFTPQTVESLASAIQRFEAMEFDSGKMIEHSKQFSAERFETDLKKFVQSI